MAEAYGNLAGSLQKWQALTSAWVLSQDDTTATVRCQASFHSVNWGFEVYGNGTASVNGASASSGTVVLRSPSGQTTNQLLVTKDVKVNKTESGFNVWCVGTVNVTGGYQNGTSEAGINVWVPGITYRVPSAPSGIWASRASDAKVNVGWKNNPSGTVRKYTGLSLERMVDGGSWVAIASLKADATSYADTGVKAGHRYAYRVRAKNNAGWSGYSTTGWVMTTPSAPTSCAASRKSDKQAHVSWKLGASAAYTYTNVLVERQADGGAWSQVAKLGASSTSYTDNGVSANHRYAYRVRAYNGLYSPFSTSGYIYTTPSAPTSCSVSKRSDKQAVVSWRLGANASYTYSNVLVERQVDGGGWSQVASLAKNATSYTDNGVSANHRYAYRVRSKNSVGSSPYSTSGTIYTTPSQPSSCAAVRKSDKQATITWKLGSNASASYLNVLIERQVDSGKFVQVATLAKGVSNYTDNGLSANHRYAYRVRAYNGSYSPYSTSGYIYTTPAAPKSVSLASIGGTKVRISLVSASPYADDYRYQVSVNGGAWSAEKAMGASVDVDAGAGSVKARVRARKGSLYSVYRESAAVTTIVPPNAPTVGKFESIYAVPATVRVKWVRSHPDGTSQTAAQVELTYPSGKVSTFDVTGAAAYKDIAISEEGEYRARVRTKGLHASWGSWSGYSSFHAEKAPNAFFTAPSSDGFVVEEVPFTVEWEIETSSGVSSQEIRLLSDSGDVLYSSPLGKDARSFSFSVGTYLPQTLKGYTAVLIMSDGYSLKAEARRRFDTDYAEPAIPFIEVENDFSDMSARIVVYQGEAGWTVDEDGILMSPEFWDGSYDRVAVSAGFEGSGDDGVIGIGVVVPTVRTSVARLLDDGSQEMISDDLPSGYMTIDRLPPLNIDYTYLVTAYSASGTATTSEISAFIGSDGSEAFNFGPDASISLLLGLNAQGDSSIAHGGEWFNFALGPDTPAMPTFYQDGSASADGSHAYVVTTAEEYRKVDAIRRSRMNAVCWFRDHWGGRHRVKADWRLGYAAESYGIWNVDVSMTETVWEDPVNG